MVATQLATQQPVTVDVEESAPDEVTVRLCGTVDRRSNPRVRDAFNGIGPFGRRRVVVDVSQASFRDVSGLATLIAARRRSVAGGGDMVLRGVDLRIGQLLAITGLRHSFRTEA